MSQIRFARLMSILAQSGLDGLALNPGATLTYLTGLQFHLMERPTVLLLAPPDQAVMILPELEASRAQASAFPLKTYTFGEDPALWVHTFQRACKDMNLDGKRIGVEPTRLRFLELNLLQEASPSTKFVSSGKILENLRLHKEPGEIADMRQAVKIAQQAFLNTLPKVKTGCTEQEIAAELTLQLLHCGSGSEFPFAPIIASGPNSADPHATPGSRVLQAGDLVVVDWGASWNGYASDLTRTLAIGDVEPEFEKIARIVLAANTAGRKASRPGATAGMVDQMARSEIESQGYGPQFFHRTGHGLGMECHETPYIYDGNEVMLAPGMTFTIEPGIYLAGRGGVRIEDNVVITPEGSETLSDLPRELYRIPVK